MLSVSGWAFWNLEHRVKTSYFLLNDAMFWTMFLIFYWCDVLTMFQKIAKHRANDVHRPPLTIRIHDSRMPTFLIWAFSRDSFSHWSHFLSSRPWWFNLYQSNSNVHHKPAHIDQEKGQFQNTKLPQRIHLVVFAPRIICSELDRSRRALLIFSAASYTAPGLLQYDSNYSELPINYYWLFIIKWQPLHWFYVLRFSLQKDFWWQIVGCNVPFSTTLRYIAKHNWLELYRRAKTPKSRSVF